MESAFSGPWTVDAFLTWERKQAERYELVDGMVRPVTSSSIMSSMIRGNLYAALREKVAPPCRVLVHGPKVVTASASLYPDVLVSCSPIVMRDDTVREPVLIAELLSHTTANDDLGAKWLAYREITGLAHYLLAWRDVQKAELYTRKTGGWDLTIIEPPAAIDLPALAVTLSFTELYDGVDFPEARMVAMM